MPSGNFSASLVLNLGVTAREAAHRSFVAALAVYDAAWQCVENPSGRFSVKWPNDVMLDQGKLAGILLESQTSGAHVDRLVIGIGVNLATAPDRDAEAHFDPISLSVAAQREVTPEEFLRLVAVSFAGFERLYQTEGFDCIRTQWLSHAAFLKQTIRARSGATELSGRFETVDADGCLVLETAEGTRRVAAADIYF